MLRICQNFHQLRFGELVEVYGEHLGKGDFLQAQQEFYAYLRQEFFTGAGDRYYIWEEDGRYICALRLQSFADGLLLEGLETRPDYRRQGYGEKLIRAVQQTTGGQRIYSHISPQNTASIALHKACGFQKINDLARYADGSVDHHCGTYCYDGEWNIK